MSTKDRDALVVLSGGQDSTTSLYWAKREFNQVRAVTFDYGQRHRIEIEAAMIVALRAQVASHDIITIPPNMLRSVSPLTSDTQLERYTSAEQMEKVIGNRIELTFVPMRNTLFLTIAANLAVHYGIKDLVTGVCGEDNANYPDCTDVFIASMQHAISAGLGAQMLIHAPLMFLDKRASVLFATTLEGCLESLAYTHTSYDGKYPPTDMNHANVLRASGFEKARMPDPLVLRAWSEGLMELPATANYDLLRAE